MSRKCMITDRKIQVGNNVSHANNRTKRLFYLNLQNFSLISDKLNKIVRIKMSVKGIRTIEKMGGLDDYLLNAKNKIIHPALIKIKKQLLNLIEKNK